MMNGEKSNKLLQLEGVTKTFGKVVANDQISLELHEGEVLALLGENGAGKSTLMNIIYGIYHPDAGKIMIRGKEVKISSPRSALNKGIGMVHQHFMLVGRYNAIENVCLISKSSPFTYLNKKKVAASLEELKARYGIDVDINCPVEQLSISGQQKIEILKLLYTGADILILDEPTAVLLPQECEALFSIIRNMTNEGKGVIFISHKLDEVTLISDRIDVLAHGKVCGHLKTSEADKNKIVRMMSGDNVPDMSGYVKKAPEEEIIFSCTGIEAYDDRNAKTLDGVDLTIRKGEIVGIAGVEGNGQSELAEVLAGTRKASAGKMHMHGAELPSNKPEEFIRNGIGYIPADRNGVGTVPNFLLFENWLMRKDRFPGKKGFIDRRRVVEESVGAIQEYDVRTTGPLERSANLSGGNLQKFILARELKKKPHMLVCSYPTRGLDVKASYFVRNQITMAKEKGTSTILFSGDMEELFSISDRIVVLNRGKVVGEKKPEETTHEEIILMMMGEKV